MKKSMSLVLALVCVLSLIAGCGGNKAEETPMPPMAQIANPWSSWDTIQEAEAAVGFSFGLPERIADTYEAESVRTMSNTLIEVLYIDGEYEVCVRKQAGEGQDISGDYTEYEQTREEDWQGAQVTVHFNSNDPAVRQLISYQGYSWSLVAPNGYWGDSGADFLNEICS